MLHNYAPSAILNSAYSHARNQFRSSAAPELANHARNPRDGWNRPGARPPLVTGVNITCHRSGYRQQEVA